MNLRILSASALGLGLLASAPASAQDSDGDGITDNADAFPCDNARASRTYYPAQGQSVLITFEDLHPNFSDNDFNDVTFHTHMAYDADASGRVVDMYAVIDPVALGGKNDNGLAVQFPFSRVGTTVEMNIGGAGWTPVDLDPTEDSATAVLFDNLRSLYGGQAGIINAEPGAARSAAPRVEVRITPGTQTGPFGTALPVDVFIFKTGSDPRHEIHFPEFSGTSKMDQSKLNVGEDISSPGRMFTHSSGVPYALNLSTTTRYPNEGVSIAKLFPTITTFASTGGAQGTNFFSANDVDPSKGHSVTANALPMEPPVDLSCTSGVASCGSAPGQRVVTIASTSAGTDIPVRITVDSADLIGKGLMSPDCGDIRVKDGQGNAVRYWVADSTCGTTSTFVWVNVPGIVAGDTVLALCSGSGAASESNGPGVFPHFFDDFNRNDSQLMSRGTASTADDYGHGQNKSRATDATNRSLMMIVDDGGAKMNGQGGNGRLKINGHSSYPALTNNVVGTLGASAAIRKRVEFTSAGGGGSFVSDALTLRNFYWDIRTAGTSYYSNGSTATWASATALPIGVIFSWEVRSYPSAINRAFTDHYSEVLSRAGSPDTSATNLRFGTGYYSTNVSYTDYVFVRKLLPSEPTVTVTVP